MIGEFAGWPRGAFDVLLQLEGEPSAEVRRQCISNNQGRTWQTLEPR